MSSHELSRAGVVRKVTPVFGQVATTQPFRPGSKKGFLNICTSLSSSFSSSSCPLPSPNPLSDFRTQIGVENEVCILMVL